MNYLMTVEDVVFAGSWALKAFLKSGRHRGFIRFREKLLGRVCGETTENYSVESLVSSFTFSCS